MEDCDIGKTLQDACHKTHYTRNKELKLLSDLNIEVQSVLLWRAGLKRSELRNAIGTTVCLHHEAKFGAAFERCHTKCANIFSTHKKPVKGGHKITLELAQKLEENNIQSVPGFQLCRSCFANTQKHSEGVDVCEGENYDVGMSLGTCDSEVEDDSFVNHPRTDLNESLQSIGISPIKTHSMPKHRRVSYAREKMNKTVTTIKRSFASAVSVEEKELCDTQRTELSQKQAEIETKAKDLDSLMVQIRDKMPSLDYRSKIQMLTLTPDSWSRSFAAEFFKVSEYLIRRARDLKSESGVLAFPERKSGRALPITSAEAVRAFFENDEYSRLMPGKKDCVSVKRNVHQQKRLLLCNLREAYTSFKEQHPEIKIGFSKFCSLRPRWCVTAGSTGTHSVCVCTIHQNAILMVQAAATDNNYKDLMDMIVCSRERKDCMVHRCDNCPGIEPLRSYLEEAYTDLDEEVSFQQWQSTDRSNLVTMVMPAYEFIDLLVEKIDALTSHSYIAKCQSRYLKRRKEEIGADTVIAIGDFAENYTFVVQDEVQSFHWSKPCCTLHPMVLYYKQDDQLQHRSFCFLSDDLEHDTCLVREIQEKLTSYIRMDLPDVENIEYFSDGCAAQYKNYKNLLNLCLHEDDFNLKANWAFFATSHGKSPCDGIGGTVKRLTSRESLQRPYSEQILTVPSMLKFCQENIENITFVFISKERMETVREELGHRFARGRTVPGTRSYHFFSPVSVNKIAYKRTSEDDEFTGTFCITGEDEQIIMYNPRINDYVACTYDGKWWIGLIQEVDNEEQDCRVSFMHPSGPSRNFYWPARPDDCWVSNLNIICSIRIPKTLTGRTYNISEDDFEHISEQFAA